MSVLAVEGLSVSYGRIAALDGLTLAVAENEIVALIGANGAGKSTFMNVVMGLTRARAGSVVLRGRPLLGTPTERMSALGIAYIPEGRGTLRNLSVQDNLRLGAFNRRDARAIAADMTAVMQRFPVLAERRLQLAGSLSGGEQQMLVIARGLMSRPKLMLLDEPTLGLAPLMVSRVLDILRELRAEGLTILLVEQNAHAALRLADRAYVLERGRVVLEGRDLLGDPRVQSAYLGGNVDGQAADAGAA